MSTVFNIGDYVRPLNSAEKEYGITKAPEMTLGVIKDKNPESSNNDILVCVIEHSDKRYIGGAYYWVSSTHFELVLRNFCPACALYFDVSDAETSQSTTCPVCGGPLTVNLEATTDTNEDEDDYSSVELHIPF